MKLLVNNKTRKIIDIEIIVEYRDYTIAASRIIDHPDNIAKKKRLNDLKLQILNDVAMSAITAINSRDHLILTKQYQAKNTYSYYIQFDVLDETGQKIIPVGIRFRISNHTMHGDELAIDSSTVVIRSFVLSGKYYENSIAIIQQIDQICAELNKGNINILDSYC